MKFIIHPGKYSVNDALLCLSGCHCAFWRRNAKKENRGENVSSETSFIGSVSGPTEAQRRDRDCGQTVKGFPMTSWMWGKAFFSLIMPNQSDFFTINASETISQCMYAFISLIYTLLYLKLASGLTEHQTGYKNKNTKTIIHTSDQFSQMFCKHGREGHRHTSGLRPTLWQIFYYPML